MFTNQYSHLRQQKLISKFLYALNRTGETFLSMTCTFCTIALAEQK